MKPTLSFLHIDDEFIRVLGAYDSLGYTESESTAGNRTVKYQVSCKACKNLLLVPKRTLMRGGFCTVCNTRWHALRGLPVLERQPDKLSDPLTIIVNGDNLTWVKGTLGTALETLSRTEAEEWVSAGATYLQFDMSNARTGPVGLRKSMPKPMLDAFNNIIAPPDKTGEEVYRAKIQEVRKAHEGLQPPPQAPKTPSRPPTPSPIPQTLPDEGPQDLREILEECHGFGEGLKAPDPIFEPPIGGRWALVPKYVYDEFQRQALTLSKSDLDSWGVLKHKVVIARNAVTSLALANPHWVYAYEPEQSTIPEF